MSDIRRGWLHLDGFAGKSAQRVIIVGETRTQYRIRADGDAVRLAGPGRSITGEETALVPKRSVSDRLTN
jgi:hypothetical protein